MSKYVISDIHGEYDMFIELLNKIKLKETDTLYILGDVLDKGPHPIKTLLRLMGMPNAVCIACNHLKPGSIYRKNNHIAVDCGASFHGGRLAAICLDTGEEFYSSTDESEMI